MTRYLLCLLLIIGCASACNTLPGAPATSPLEGKMAFSITSMGLFSNPEGMYSAQENETSAKPSEEKPSDEDKEESRSLLTTLLLYIPNRVVDLFDIARAGVSVGPGIGVDLTATEYMNATLMAKASVGIGFQTLRHLPIESAAYTMVGAGPLELDFEPGLSWYRSEGDFRVELHVLIVGAHVAVEPFEIFDFIVGFALFDPEDDDF